MIVNSVSQPDLAKFHMKSLDKDIVGLFARRAYDVAGSSAGIKVLLNGEKLPVSYLDIFICAFTHTRRTALQSNKVEISAPHKAKEAFLA